MRVGFSAAFAAAIIMAATAYAAERGSGEPLSARQIVDIAPRAPERAASSRSGGPGLAEAFAIRSRSADGREGRKPAPRTVLDAIRSAAAGTALTAPPRGIEPSGAETGRHVFGDDDRVRVERTDEFPFSAIGQIWARTADGKWGICSATLIAPRVVLTAAHCLYNHDAGGFFADYEFYPGLDGLDHAPYGKFAFAEAFILDGYASGYQGFYGSVMPWDLGVLLLKEPAGETTGWMDFEVYDPPYGFLAHVVGYPGDKPASTMWRVACDVDPGQSDGYNFSYACDTFPGSSGSAVYRDDPVTGRRVVVGVNVAENAIANIAVGLNRAYHAWVLEASGARP